MGQPSPIKVTPIRLGNSQTQHPQGMVQEGPAASNQNDSTTEKASLNEDTEETTELQNSEEASDIWNRAKKLGATGGDDRTG